MAEPELLTLDQMDKKRLAGEPVTRPYDPDDRLFADFQSGRVFDTGDTTAREVKTMLARDGRARSLEQVLTLPLRSATWSLQGTGEAAKLVRENLDDKLGLLIDQMTSAVAFRKAFFELVWTYRDGRLTYEDIAYRPATGCEQAFDAKTGRPQGFRQRITNPGGVLLVTGDRKMPGYVDVPPAKAFVYTHGKHREPVSGVSDLDVARWCWSQRQKVLFLWFQYLENQSLPKAVAYGDDPTQARQNAETLSQLKSSGVAGVQRPADPAAKLFDLLEASGKGADQFENAVRYLEQQMTASVLAGFTELATAASNGQGSYALSQDQSEFFLNSRQAVADEIADAINRGVIRPLVAYNYGVDAALSSSCPKLVFNPLSQRTAERAVGLLQTLVPSADKVPDGFIGQLVEAVATYVGLDPAKVHKLVEATANQAAQQASAERSSTPTADTAAAALNAGKQAADNPGGVDDALAQLGLQ